MLSKEDQEFIADAKQALSENGTLEKAGESLGMNPNTFYTKIRRLGYRIEKETRLVPIHPVENDTAA